jgi:hypothetical protein
VGILQSKSVRYGWNGQVVVSGFIPRFYGVNGFFLSDFQYLIDEYFIPTHIEN